MSDKTSQTEAILQHLRTYGSITFEQAFNAYGVHSITRRIRDLREAGHKIISESTKHKVTGRRYVRYHLAENTAQRAAAVASA